MKLYYFFVLIISIFCFILSLPISTSKSLQEAIIIRTINPNNIRLKRNINNTGDLAISIVMPDISTIRRKRVRYYIN